ncbi:MAG: hypothetical protein HY825_16260 [Acidobacteria bacterium]|nr:hypothetical protein [Acidobacteriota bacterium]
MQAGTSVAPGSHTPTAPGNDVRPPGREPGARAAVFLLLASLAVAAACSLALFTDEPADGGDGGADVDGGAEAADADGDVLAETEAETEPDGDALEEAEADGSAGRAVGEPCNLSEQCADGLVPGECMTMVGAIEAPEGYCTGIGCLRDDDCPGGAAAALCAEMVAGVRVCLDRCTSQAECRPGYACLDPDGDGPGGFGCAASCSAEGGCPSGQSCDPGGFPPLCHLDAGARANGDPCEHHYECRPGSYCLAERALLAGWPRGYCTQDCAVSGDCRNGGACVLACADDDGSSVTDPCDDDGMAGLDPDNQGLCMTTCTRVPDSCSRPGYSCQALGPTFLRNQDVCAVACRDGSSPCDNVGWTCDPNAGSLIGGSSWGSGRCQPPLDVPALGEPCAATTGCRGGMCLAESVTGYPRGLCTEECGVGDPCPEPFACSGLGLFTGLCFRPCTLGGTECRPGTVCQDLGWGILACAAACTANADCDNTCCSQFGTGYCDPHRAECML